MTSRLLIAALALGAMACGDPETEDERGYTKAPLENPGLLIGGENATAMAQLGRPNLPRGELLEMEVEGEAEQEGAGEAQVTLAPGVTQEQFDQGRDLFAGQGACQACHGPNGSGSQLAPNLADDEWLNISEPTVDQLAEVIREGVPQPQEHPAPMPPMGGADLSDEQVQALAGYVASLSAD